VIETIGNTPLVRLNKIVKDVDWPEGFYRTDIGWRAIERDG